VLDENSDREFDEMIRKRIQVAVPADVEDRLRRRLAEFRTRVEQRPPSRIRSLAYSLMHPPSMRVATIAAALAVALVAALVFLPRGSNRSRVYAAAAGQLRSARSLQYTIVLVPAPYVAVEFSYLAPGYQRFNCSWGIEVRADRTAARQIVLIHFLRKYLAETGKGGEDLATAVDLMEQLRSLPQAADESIGEQWESGNKLIGYRVRKTPLDTSIPGLYSLDVWVDAGTREVHRVDITVQEEGKPPHQMQIKDIRVDAELSESLFDLTPPAGYTAILAPAGEPQAGVAATPQEAWVLRAEIGQAGALVAAVVPMKGSYLQAPAALQTVESGLRRLGVTPLGPPMGRFESEQQWEVGYPVPSGTRVEAPAHLISIPGELVASVVVNGPWGKDPDARWTAFLKSIVEQGYIPAGPPMESWSGDGAKPSTEMRISVRKAN
jgi:hypothetical protein